MSEETNKGRNRSPNYPYLSLPDAISRTCIILEKDKLNPTSPEVIVGHLGYSNLNGTSRRVLAAMKDYGLLEEVGNKRFKVSNLGYRLCKNNEDGEERGRLLKEAALRPYFFNSLIEEYKGDLPSPETLEDFLVLHKDFSPDGAQTLQKVLRETVEYANINPEDFEKEKPATPIQSDKGETNNQGRSQGGVGFFDSFFNGMSSPAVATEKDKTTPTETGIKLLFKYSVPLSIQRNVDAQLVITGESLKKRDLETLAKKVKDLVDAFEEEDNAIRREAIWHNKDFDVPVIVISEPELGEDNREYVAIEGSRSRIPFEEVEFVVAD